ncbi:hypothetical protein [Wenyingzhuangia aestuarii]|uniref:hypothetical protein n=1 Tax=Wenyingzhuangia aestuarii TaxID=1647582 RepID=UPI00143C33E3|nr:hypothetical protein [Wenyingzhuangia aestuarii]NJB82120.1 hypothetical protein [Wenyingzhuangia aestuarii]
MSTPPTKEEIKEIASHLRKPEGTKGIEIANMMNDGNQPMNLHTLAVVNPLAIGCFRNRNGQWLFC